MSPRKPAGYIAQPRNTSASSARDATNLLQLHMGHTLYDISRETKRIFVKWYCTFMLEKQLKHSFCLKARFGYRGKGKGKTVPLQARSDPEGSRKLRFPDCMTTAQDGGKVVSLTHRPPLPPANTPGTHLC